MGLVDADNRVNFYDGDIRVVDPNGKQFAKFPARDYLKHVAEHVETWSYVKFPYLKPFQPTALRYGNCTWRRGAT